VKLDNKPKPWQLEKHVDFLQSFGKERHQYVSAYVLFIEIKIINLNYTRIKYVIIIHNFYRNAV